MDGDRGTRVAVMRRWLMVLMACLMGCCLMSTSAHADPVGLQGPGLQQVADVESHCRESTIFASNTSSIPIAKIAANAARPEQVIGLHYFSPVDKMPLVEVIIHPKTSASTISTTVEFARRQGKTPIVVQDGAGFYVNRILAPYMNEAANILLSGEPVKHLDNALMSFGFPVGPMKLLDEVGIDVGASAGASSTRARRLEGGAGSRTRIRSSIPYL